MPKAKSRQATALRTVDLETVAQYTELVQESITRTKGNPAWFRGCGCASYGLVPSLYRHPTITDSAKLIEMEARILTRFKQRSLPYQTRTIDNVWDYLFFMQHFGIPTRLLDWTENPYIALYFALTARPQSYDGPTPVYTNDAAVWVLNPTTWNNKVLDEISWTGGILSQDDKTLEGYEPFRSSKLIRNQPVAIYGSYNSYRIVAQKGVFTIFGKSLYPMEKTYTDLRFPPETLLKIRIEASRINSLLSQLLSIGITDSVVFPDLDGLAKETKRFFGYNI